MDGNEEGCCGRDGKTEMIPTKEALKIVLGKCLPPASVREASDGSAEYPLITESRAGNDGLDVTVTPGTVASVTTGPMGRKEVTVDNRFLKAHNPLLLIEFYEQHLKYNRTF